MGDAAYLILIKKSESCTGRFYLDEEILKENGIFDFSMYSVDEKDIIKLKTLR